MLCKVKSPEPSGGFSQEVPERIPHRSPQPYCEIRRRAAKTILQYSGSQEEPMSLESHQFSHSTDPTGVGICIYWTCWREI